MAATHSLTVMANLTKLYGIPVQQSFQDVLKPSRYKSNDPSCRMVRCMFKVCSLLA